MSSSSSSLVRRIALLTRHLTTSSASASALSSPSSSSAPAPATSVIRLSPEVFEALYGGSGGGKQQQKQQKQQPVVALESTIITHGFFSSIAVVLFHSFTLT